jgi:hypothetical protein
MSKVDIINAILDAAKQRREDAAVTCEVRYTVRKEEEKLLTSADMEAYKRGRK